MSSSSLKILGAASSRTFRCLWMAEELQVQYEHVVVRPGSKKLTPFNPLGKVPVLIDGEDFVLYESAAINTYLGEGTDLVPPANKRQERARYNQLVYTILTEVDAQGLWIHRKHGVLGEYFGTIPEAVVEAKRCFDKAQEKVLIPTLQKSANETGDYFLLGSNFTAADILYVHCLDWAKSIGWLDTVFSTNILKDYHDRCRARPAYQKVAAMRRAEAQKEKDHDNKSSNL